MQKSGITLIALVVTIIVLIILAAVSLNLLFGQNGIITRAQQSARETKLSAFKEKLEMEIAAIVTDLLVSGKEPNLTNVEEKLDELGYHVTPNPNGDGSIIVETDDGGKATVHPDLTVEVEGAPSQSGGGSPTEQEDTTAPTGVASYSTTAPTSGSVIVTIDIDEPIIPLTGDWVTIGTDRKKYTREYTMNVTETIEIIDLAGNVGYVTINISNIDNTNPTGMASYSPNTLTEENVTVTITTSKEINTPYGWIRHTATTYKKEYTENKTEAVQIVDLLGNSGVVQVAVTNIHKTIYGEASIPREFVVSTTPGETTVDEGLVIIGPDGSEFVWVPVPNPVLDVQGKTDAQINTAIQEEVLAGRHPMAIKINSTDYKGVLYTFSGTTTPATVTPVKYTTNGTGYREPDILTNTMNFADSASNISSYIQFGMTQAQFKVKLQREYNAMVSSVIDKGGFYVGRYQTSLNGGYTQSKYNKAPSNANWYDMYNNQKAYVVDNDISGVTSGMIYGSQWDQIMIWMRNVKNPDASNKPYIVDSTNMGWYKNNTTSRKNTGTLAKAKVNNIFDLAGNAYEWTQEARTDLYRSGRRRILWRGRFCQTSWSS